MDLRLGVSCAVLDDSGKVLLTLREGLKSWALPGGGVASGEFVLDAAVREVYEETGIRAHIDRATGIYYWSGMRLLSILCLGLPLNNGVRAGSRNGYFSPDALPPMRRHLLALDALAGTRHKPRVIDVPRDEMRRWQTGRRLRRVKNWLRGRREARFSRFQIEALGVVWDDDHRRVLTVQGKRSQALPRVVCTGERAPWEALTAQLQAYGVEEVAFRWVGLWQDTRRDVVELIFAASIGERDVDDAEVEWSLARNLALPDREAEYLERIRPGYAFAPVWLLKDEADVDSIELDKEQNL